MVSKLQALREGRSVQIREGVFARLNPEKKTMEFSTGEIRHIGDDPDYFPKTDIEKKRTSEKERIEREIEAFPGGTTAGQFAYQVGQKTAFSGIKDWANYLTKTGEGYLAGKQAEQQVGEKIESERPILSGAATAASLIPDLAATAGMSGATAVPALIGIGAGPRIIEQPGEVAAEAASGALGGFLIDKGASFLGRIAERRGASREISGKAAEIESFNVSERERVSQLNRKQQEDYLKTKEWISRQNEALQHQYNLELNARQNKMIEAKNEYERAKSTQALGNEKAKSDYEIAKKEYENTIRNIPVLQTKAEEVSGERAISASKEAQKLFPVNAQIDLGELGAKRFIEEGLQKSGKVGSREASQALKIIKTLFPEGEKIYGRDLFKKIQSLEASIVKSSPEVREILHGFKDFLSTSIPLQIAETIAFKQGFPVLKKNILPAFKNALSSSGLKRGQIAEIVREIEVPVSKFLEDIPAQNFQNVIRSGFLSNELIQSVLPLEKYISLKFPNLKALEKKGLKRILEKSAEYKGAISEYAAVSKELSKQIDSVMSDAFISGMEASEKALRESKIQLQPLRARPSSVEIPESPELPISIPSPRAPETPPMPPQPLRSGFSPSPVPQEFSQTTVPQLPQALGSAEMVGDVLEKDPMEFLKSKSGPIGTLGSLAGLKYAFGSKAAPIAASGFYGLKALTSPTAAGAAARITFREGGVGAIEQMMRKYPSYREGILDDPMERRSVNKEIEDDNTIPIGQKAIFQSKINRGKPLSVPLD